MAHVRNNTNNILSLYVVLFSSAEKMKWKYQYKNYVMKFSMNVCFNE